MVSCRQLLPACLMFVAASLVSALASAQTARPVRLVVGFAAGGATDVIARQLAERLREAYPEGVIVENRPGGNGLVAVDHVKNSTADGATLLFAPDFTFTIFPHSYRKLRFDPDNDFIPIATVGKTRVVFAVGPGVPESVRTLADFIQWVKANPKLAAFGSSGLGGGFHFIGVRMNRALGVDMTHIPYKGGAPLLQDLVGGQIPSSPVALGQILPFVQAGKVRALAVYSPARSPLLPDMPTMVELGYKDFVVEQWVGVFAPARTPAAVVAKLRNAINEAQKSREFGEGLSKLGMEISVAPPEGFAALIKLDSERWAQTVKASGYVAEE